MRHKLTPSRVALLVAFVLLCMPYAFATPVFEKNDESEHFAFAQHLANTGALPIQPAKPTDHWQQEGSQPPLYYALAALVLRIFDTRDFESQLVPNASPLYVPFAPNNHNKWVITPSKRAFNYQGSTLAALVLRLLGIVPGAVAVWCSYGVALALARQHRTALLAMAFTAFNPMLLHLSTSVSNDALVIALCSASLVLITRPNPWTMRRAVAVGSLVACASLTKLGGLLLLPIAALAIVRSVAGVRAATRLCIGLGGAWLLVAGWWFVRNVQLYGELTGANTMAAVAGPRQATLAMLADELLGFRMSYLGIFGWFNVTWPMPVYWAWDVFLLACAAGLALSALRRKRAHIKQQLGSDVAWLCVGLHIAFTLIAIVRWTSMTMASQGRLLFPCIAAISTLLALGSTALYDLLFNLPRRPMPRIPHPASLFAAAFGLLALATPWLVIWPAYQPPLLAQLPPTASPVQQSIKPYAEVLGYTMSPPQVHPGETVRVSVFMRALQPTDFDYALVVKLYGAGKTELARFDTYTGNGLWPSTFWRAGDVIRDDVDLRIPVTASAPSVLRLQVELYNHGSGAIAPSFDALGKAGAPLFDGVTLLAAPQATSLNWQAQFGNFARIDSASANAQFVQVRWETLARAPTNYTVFVHVLDAAGTMVAQADAPPARGDFPSTRWAAGNAFDDVYSLGTPLQAGKYRVRVGLYDAGNGTRAAAFNPQQQRLADDAFEFEVALR